MRRKKHINIILILKVSFYTYKALAYLLLNSYKYSYKKMGYQQKKKKY